MKMELMVTKNDTITEIKPGTYRATCMGALLGVTLPFGSADSSEYYPAIQFKFIVDLKGQTGEIWTSPAKVPTHYHSGYNFFKYISALLGRDLEENDVVELPDFDVDELPRFFTKGERAKELPYLKVNGEDILTSSAIIKVALNQAGTRTKVAEVLAIPEL